MTYKLKVGLELEAITYYPLCENIEIGDYHDGIGLTRRWEVQRDGSVGRYETEEEETYEPYLDDDGNETDDGETIRNWAGTEYVSKPFYHKDLGDVLGELKTALKQTSAFKHFKIDKSCGAHIHFTVVDGSGYEHILPGIIPTKYLIDIRKKMFELVKDKYPDKLAKFKQGYYRNDYCRAIENYMVNQIRDTSKYFLYDTRDRHTEFNFNGDTPEWRAMHLWCADDWNEVYRFYDLALTAMESVLLPEFEKEEPFMEDGLEDDIKVVEFRDTNIMVNNIIVCSNDKPERRGYHHRSCRPTGIAGDAWEDFVNKYSR